MAPRPSHANRSPEALRNRQRREELQKLAAFLKTLTPEQLDSAKLITEANTVKGHLEVSPMVTGTSPAPAGNV